MTGSATKQSILSFRGEMDRFACARNDGSTPAALLRRAITGILLRKSGCF
jgi:hypothetical protein